MSSSLLLTFPYQCNRFSLRNVNIWHTLASSCILWFLTWSFLVLPLIHRSILISASCNLFSSFFLIAQQSAPYVIVGLITVLYTLSFSLNGTFLSHSTPVSCFHFIQASLTRLLMSLSAPPFESNSDPKYLNVVTVFSLSSPSCISSYFLPLSPSRSLFLSQSLLPQSLPQYVPLSPSLSLYLSHSLDPLSPPLSMSLSLSLFLSHVHLYISLTLSLSLPPPLSLSLTLSLFLPHPLSLLPPISLSIYLYLYTSLPLSHYLSPPPSLPLTLSPSLSLTLSPSLSPSISPSLTLSLLPPSISLYTSLSSLPLPHSLSLSLPHSLFLILSSSLSLSLSLPTLSLTITLSHSLSSIPSLSLYLSLSLLPRSLPHSLPSRIASHVGRSSALIDHIGRYGRHQADVGRISALIDQKIGHIGRYGHHQADVGRISGQVGQICRYDHTKPTSAEYRYGRHHFSRISALIGHIYRYCRRQADISSISEQIGHICRYMADVGNIYRGKSAIFADMADVGIRPSRAQHLPKSMMSVVLIRIIKDKRRR